MKGIVLAGGRGTRLHPLTKIINKHLLLVGNEPMIFNPLRKLIEAGIRDILIITNSEDVPMFRELLGDGKTFGAVFHYQAQLEASGTGSALLSGEAFAGGENIIVVYGDNITTTSLTPYIQSFSRQNEGALILLKEVKDPRRFGVATVSGNRITDIEEKPDNPKSNLAITGIIMYTPGVFDVAKKLERSARGEYEMTDIYRRYMESGKLRYEIIKGEWVDAGTPESLAEAARLLLKLEVQGGNHNL